MGADGTNSTGEPPKPNLPAQQTSLMGRLVRQQLIPHDSRINNLPVACVVGGAVLPKVVYERQLQPSHSYHLVFGTDCRLVTLIGSVAPDKQSAWYYWRVNWIDEDARQEDYWLRTASAADRLALARRKCAQIDPRPKEVLEATAPDGMGGYIPVRDLIPATVPDGRVTLLGDAWHPMTFFKGEGGNHVMQDALDLGRILHDDALARRHLYAAETSADWVHLLADYGNNPR